MAHGSVFLLQECFRDGNADEKIVYIHRLGFFLAWLLNRVVKVAFVGYPIKDWERTQWGRKKVPRSAISSFVAQEVESRHV